LRFAQYMQYVYIKKQESFYQKEFEDVENKTNVDIKNLWKYCKCC